MTAAPRLFARVSRAALVFVFVLVAALAVAAALPAHASADVGAPSIWSDQPDYAPGETVTLRGDGWGVGESVHINVNDDEGQTWSRDVDVTADLFGNISDQFQLPDWFVATYSVTATGMTSGIATTTFTDGNIRIASAPSGVTFTLTWEKYDAVGCTGNVTDSGTALNVGSAGGARFTRGAGNTESIKWVAADSATTPAGRVFRVWTSGDAFTANFGGERHTICTNGFGGNGTRDYVANYNTAPSVTPAANQSTNEGAATTFGLGSFSDAQSDSPWTVTVDWGDGSPSSTFTKTATGSLGSLPHTYADGPNTFTVTVTVTGNGNGAGGASRSATFTVTVNNVGPTVAFTSAPASANEGQTKTYTYSISDPGVDTVSSVTTSCGANGTKSNAANTNTSGSFDCTFPDGPAGSTVSASAIDSDGATGNTATQAVTVANVAPTAASQSVTTAEDSAKLITLSSSDPGPDAQTFSIVAGPSHGSLSAIGAPSCTGSGPKNCSADVTYTPDLNYYGPDSFQFKANDGIVDSTAATVSITVTPLNDAPVAVDDDVAGTEDVDKTMTKASLLANDTDVDSGTLSLTAVSNASGGTAEISGSDVVFHPALNLCGNDAASFDYTVSDGALTDTGTVTLDLTCVNDEPTLNAISDETVDEDATEQTVLLNGIGSGAANESQTLTVTASSDNTAVIPNPTVVYTSPNATGSLKYTPVVNQHGTATITVTVTDDGGIANSGDDTKTRTFTITVRPVNDEPSAAADRTSITMDEDGVAEDVEVSGSDVETGAANLVFTITDAPDHGILENGATALTLNSTFNGSPKTLSYDSDPNYNGSDSWAFKVTDRGDPDGCTPVSVTCTAAKDSDAVTVSITVNPVNDTPSADDGSVSVAEDGSASIDLRALVADIETSDANLTYTIVSGPSHGTLSATATNGVRSYAPAADYNGSDSFAYKVTDRGDPDGCSAAPCAAAKTSATKTVSITVDPVNDMPVANDGNASVDEDGSTVVDLSTKVSDLETGDADLTYTIVSGPSHGTLLAGITPGSYSYSPAGDYNGSDSFTYNVTDRGDPDGCTAAPCDAAETSATKTISITVTPVNDTPSAGDGSASVAEDGSASIDLRGLVADVETSDANLTYTIVAGPSHGTLSATATNGVRSYAPAADYNGSDSFTYKVTDRGDPDGCSVVSASCDAAETSATKTVSITVDPVNDTPSASDGSKTIAEDASATAIDLRALVSDVETADADLSYTIVSGPSHGTLVPGSTNGSFDYDSASNYNGSDSFAYKVTDRGDPDGCSAAPCDAAETSATKTISITISAVNDKPSAAASPTSVSMSEDGAAASVVVSGSDVETVDGALAFTITAAPTHGTLKNGGTTLATGGTFTGSPTTLTYAPAANYNGGDSFSFKVRDTGDGSSAALESDVVSVPITVAPVNDTPNASVGSRAVNEDEPATVDLRPLADDVETSDANLTYNIVSGPSHGTLTPVAGANGSFTYAPASNYNGGDSFTYSVTDRGDPDNCSAAPCDAPKTSETQTFSLTVNPVNDQPNASDGTASINEDAAPITVDLTPRVDDVETSDANLTYTIVTTTSHGTLTPVSGSNGSFSYDSASNYNGSDSFAYKVTDRGDPDGCSAAPCAAAKTSATKTIAITINPVNDGPNANDGSQTLAEDAAPTAMDLRPLVDDVETLDANLTYTIVTQPAHGTLATTATNGVLNYDSDLNYYGADSFTYKVTDRGDPDGCSTAPCDAAKTSATKTVSITVTPVNDAPAIDIDTVAAGQQKTRSDSPQYSDALTYNVAATDVDNTAAQLTFNASGLPANVTLTDNHDGTATVSGNVGVQAGTYVATIVVKDPSMASDSGTATANVTREDATIEYTGDTVGLTGSTGMTLRATVWDSAAADSGFTGDTTIGNITKMYIQFDIYSATSCGTGTPTATRTAQVSDTGTLADGIGTATAVYASSSEASYCVVAKLIGSLTTNTVNAWYQANNAPAAVITFYNNTGQFVTGGGWIVDPNGGGNHKGNFGFNARFNKSGAPQGQMVYVYRGLYNGELADYRIKSNSLTSLGFSCWNGTAYGPCPLGNASFPARSTLEGKSTIQINRARDGYVMFSDGNANFSATVVDSGQSSGIGSDTYSLTVYDKNAVLYKSVPTTLLGGGNVVIHGAK